MKLTSRPSQLLLPFAIITQREVIIAGMYFTKKCRSGHSSRERERERELDVHDETGIPNWLLVKEGMRCDIPRSNVFIMA